MSTTTATNRWTKKVSSGEGGDFELPKGGSHPGCLVGLIDLGTHDNEYQGKKTEQLKVMLVFELTAEFDTKGETFKVAKEFTFSLNSKAKLRAFLETWLSRKFGDDEEIDISSFMLKNGLVNLTDGLSGGGKKFVDIASVTPPPKGLTVPDRTVEPFVFSLDGWDTRKDPPVPDWVPRNFGREVKDDIKKSKEWMSAPPF